METITPLVQAIAGEAFDAFEQVERGEFEQVKRGDNTITVLRDNAPQWIYDAVRSVHGEFLPDDWRYDQTQNAFGAIHDASEGAYVQEVGDGFCDGAVDIYTSARLQWLASNLNRPAYCDEAVSEGLVSDPDTDMVERIGMGQYMEAREIFECVVSALEGELAERESNDDDGKI